MKLPVQPRASVVSRCVIAFTLAGLSVTTLAQAAAPPIVTPVTAPSTPSTEKSADHNLDKRQLKEADNAYLAGARLLDRKESAGAELQFAKALKLNPYSRDYALALSIAHEQHVTQLVQDAGKARLLGQDEKADTLLAEARLLDPSNSVVAQHFESAEPTKIFRPEIEPWIREAPAISGPVTLLPNSTPQNFHLHSDVQEVVRRVLSSYGIRVVFDEGVPHQDVRFNLEQTQYQQAVPILLRMTQLFAVPLDTRTVLVAQDTPDNRQRYQRQLQETIFVPAMTVEEMDSLANVIRQVFEVKQLSVEKSSGDLILRAPEDVLKAVNLTLSDLIDGGSEVMIELKLYSVDKSRQRNIGTQTPQQIGIYSVASAAQDIVNQNQALVQQGIAQGLIPADASDVTIALALISSGLVQSTVFNETIGLFGGGATLFGVTEDRGTTLNLGLSSSESRALEDIQTRIGDRQTATFRVGTRYPIITATYTNTLPTSALAGVNINGVSAASLLSQVSSTSTIPQIQFEDLGLTLKATPVVQKSGEISMHLDLKIESLTGTSADDIPILANRAFVSDVTVPDGQSALILSTLDKSESASIDGLPGIGELPGFQSIAADRITQNNSTELIVLITPHVVRRRSNLTAGPRIALNLPAQPD
jgi:hypothetical protein